MTAHTIQVNNFITNENEARSNVDKLSKIFITFQGIIGVNRIGLLTQKSIINALATIYVVFAIFGFTYMLASVVEHATIINPVFVKLIQYTFCASFCFTSRNKLLQYYNQLKKIDDQASCDLKVNRATLIIFLSMFITSMMSLSKTLIKRVTSVFTPLHLIQTFENHYYAYLFNLLNQRLQVINNRIEASLVRNPRFATTAKVDSVKSNKDGQETEPSMRKLMDSYYLIIDGYNFLIDGIGWQLFFLLTTSFSFSLILCYDTAKMIISGEYQSYDILSNINLLGSEVLPLIAPCMCCDKIRQEVLRLRELLAFKLFEGKLDKSNRSVARTLLALTKTRNLSFSLLRMIDISVSLPFSFLGVTATYLIILLQFQKAINPEGHFLFFEGNSSKPK